MQDLAVVALMVNKELSFHSCSTNMSLFPRTWWDLCQAPGYQGHKDKHGLTLTEGGLMLVERDGQERANTQMGVILQRETLKGMKPGSGRESGHHMAGISLARGIREVISVVTVS